MDKQSGKVFAQGVICNSLVCTSYFYQYMVTQSGDHKWRYISFPRESLLTKFVVYKNTVRQTHRQTDRTERKWMEHNNNMNKSSWLWLHFSVGIGNALCMGGYYSGVSRIAPNASRRVTASSQQETPSLWTGNRTI